MTEHAHIDPARFRTVCGHFATGVTVVTAMNEGEPAGIAVNSFTSVSLDPPLVLFCAAKTSTTWPSIRAAGHYTVNFLAEDQEPVSWAFASKEGDRFAGLAYREGVTGAPILTDALAFLECVIDEIHDAGDHEIVVGRVVDLDVQREAAPLVFFRGGYANLA